MAGFRNLLVHNYTRVKAEFGASVVTHDIADLLQFTSAIRAALPLTNESG